MFVFKDVSLYVFQDDFLCVSQFVFHYMFLCMSQCVFHYVFLWVPQCAFRYMFLCLPSMCSACPSACFITRSCANPMCRACPIRSFSMCSCACSRACFSASSRASPRAFFSAWSDARLVRVPVEFLRVSQKVFHCVVFSVFDCASLYRIIYREERGKTSMKENWKKDERSSFPSFSHFQRS